MPYDIDNPTRADKIDEVEQGLENVIAALRTEKVEINFYDIVFLSDVDKENLDEPTHQLFLESLKKLLFWQTSSIHL